MGWFSPVKGAYPSLGQVDKTLPVEKAFNTLRRGMIVALGTGDGSKYQSEGIWKLPAAATDILYIALQDYNDPTAGFAGTSFDPKGDGTPRVTAIDVHQDGEYETDMFDPAIASTVKIGDMLYASATGYLTTDNSATGAFVGYVTGVPTERWVNNAVAVPPGNNTDPRLAVRTGANVTVIRFKTGK